MKNKIHEAPEFQVIKMNEANAKFYAASYQVGNYDVYGSPETTANNTMSYSRSNAQWF